MIVLDTSAWIEMSLGTAIGREFVKLTTEEPVVLSAIAVYEILRYTLKRRPDQVDVVEVQLRGCTIVGLDADLSRTAAEVSVRHDLAMADAIVYATAHSLGARLATCDAHFEGLPAVIYRKKS